MTSPLEIVTVPCLSDNYAYLIRDAGSGEVALVDAPEAAPIRKALESRGWGLDHILITHHHGDHIAGVEELRKTFGAKTVGAAADAERLPALDTALDEGDIWRLGETEAEVIDVSGHTVGHIAFHFPAAEAAFTADSLMALGCGRVFEGTHLMMWRSLSKLAALPAATLIYSGHEYTAKNAAFARSVEPDNEALAERADRIEAARGRGEPTVPAALSEELATNPFLRAGEPAVKAGVGMADAEDAAVFAEIRRRRDAH